MYQKTRLCAALAFAFGSVLQSGVVLAQDEQPQRIEITGSAIRRVDAETAVPVTIIKMSDLKAEGITSVEQVIQSLAAVQMQTGVSQTVGASTGGASFADMRGIGANKTLVLLNGRRIANNAFDGTAPDLNMIPFAAIERVEVLRDGASSLYGTDAIGGVINFITRKDYTGFTVTAGYDKPEKKGGEQTDLNVGFGFGNLASQGFNVLGFVDYQKSGRIAGTDRPYNVGGGLSPTTAPANYYQDGSVVGNPTGPDCTDAVFGVPAGDGSCFISTSKFVDYTPKVERVSGMLKGTLNITENHQLGLEYFVSQSNVQTRIAPVPYGLLYQNPVMPNGEANPYYPGNSGNSFVPAFTPDLTWDGGKAGVAYGANGTIIQPGYMVVKWRDLFNGSRGDENVNTQQRLLASLNGMLGDWDYKAGVSWNENKVDEKLISGYSNGSIIQAGVLEGVINPYSLTQTQSALDLINSAALNGTLMSGKGTTTNVDFSASRELADWFGAGRASALALGAEYRHEDMHQFAHADFASKVVASTGIDPATDNKGSRDVNAVFAELQVPLTKTLDATAAVRWDDYSDFGGTTNPKFSFRWQPSKQFLMRGSYSTGFRAPSLYELYSPQAYTNSSTVDDPLTCPNGVPTGAAINNCNAQFQTLTGGNTKLKPEKSKSWTLGFVVEPSRELNFGVDLWWVRLTDQIGAIGDQTLYDPANYAMFSQYFYRDSTGHLSTDGTACPGSDCGYVDTRTQNLGGLHTNGIDLSAAYKLSTDIGVFDFSYNSTYVAKYEYQDYKSGPWNQNVGVFSGVGPIFRWQHNLAATWHQGAYTAGVAAHYKTGYVDEDPSRRVSDYSTTDLFGSWAVTKEATVTLGVRNLFDRNPPYSNQQTVFQAGYDPRYSSAEGRAFYIRASYSL